MPAGDSDDHEAICAYQRQRDQRPRYNEVAPAPSEERINEFTNQFTRLLLDRRDFQAYSSPWVDITWQIVRFFEGCAPFDSILWTCNRCDRLLPASRFNILMDACTDCDPAAHPQNTLSFVRQRLDEMEREANADPSREINRYIREDHLAQPCLTPLGRPPYFGVELEVESVGGVSNLVPSAKQVGQVFDDFVIIKRDGSLRCGFEICTRPASIKEHRAQWKRFFAASGQIPIQILDSCGLHVHVARRGLSDLTVAKIVCFVNAYHNRRFIRCIAGRSENTFAQIKKKKMTNASVCSGDRYEAVNICCSETIEFRLFKGTLQEAHFFKALEFCDAMRVFCSPGARSLRESMRRSEFTHFVKQNQKWWPHLSAFIDAKWYGRETQLTQLYGFTTQHGAATKKKQKKTVDSLLSF